MMHSDKKEKIILMLVLQNELVELIGLRDLKNILTLMREKKTKYILTC